MGEVPLYLPGYPGRDVAFSIKKDPIPFQKCSLQSFEWCISPRDHAQYRTRVARVRTCEKEVHRSAPPTLSHRKCL